jgi:hypothetical protein
VAETLAQLMQAKTADEREAQLLAMLNGAGFPTTDWYPGSVARTLVKMVTTGLLAADALIPAITTGGFLGPFTVNDKVYPTRDWLEIKAAQDYDTVPAPAVKAKQRLKMWHVVGTGPTVISAASQFTARSASGRLYRNTTLGTVIAGTLIPTKLLVEFEAESAGSVYNGDTAGSIVELVTPLPGLIIANEPLSFGGVDTSGRAARNGTGTGTVTPSETVAGVAPTPSRTFTLTITNAGQVSAAVGSLVIDDGVNPSTTVPLSPIPATYVAGGGVTITFANGAQNPSFLVGDVYTFQAPGSPIINPGSDAESSDSLRTRCRGRWPSLSAVPTEDRYAGWIRQASIDNGYGVTKITVNPSVTIAGQVDIRVATSAGAVPGGVVTALQAYVDLRDGIVDLANVASAVNNPVTAGGTVTVRSSVAVAAKAAAKAAWESYIADLPIGGERSLGGVVVLEELDQAIMDAGALDVSGLTLNGVAANLSLTSIQVATAANSIDTALTWLEVP